MTRTVRRVARTRDEGDMHYHCEECFSTSPVPGLCHKEGCPGRGEEMTMCRKLQCAPGD